MSKFGLLHEEEELPSADLERFSEKLAAFAPTAPKHRIDLVASDAAAAAHGFVSREPASIPIPVFPSGRRRRLTPVEPTRHLAIRLTASQYDRFVAYADKHKLTYHDALSRLLDESTDQLLRRDRGAC